MDHSSLNLPNYNRLMLQDVQKSRLEDIINLYNEHWTLALKFLMCPFKINIYILKPFQVTYVQNLITIQ
jgi:hypothetical protein